jgi:peptide/nickel transport system permease protein
MKQMLRRFLRDKAVMVGLTIFLAMLLMALFAPYLSPHDPIQQDLRMNLAAPSAPYFMGTDYYGRDVLSRIIWGARVSLQVGMISVGISLVAGSIVGLISGYYGGWIDAVLMRVMDVMLAFPFFLLALAIVAALGPNLVNAMLAIGIASTPSFARLVRGSVLMLKENTYVEAARSAGAGDTRIVIRHLVPNLVGTLVTFATVNIANAILAEASLSFLGLGVQPPDPSWGSMLSEGRNFMRNAPWIATFPGIAILVSVLGLNLLGDGLRDILDPRWKN